MRSSGKICPYCSRPIGADEPAALCDRCHAAVHAECWDRNGRCATFRCAGMPDSMPGAQIVAAQLRAMEASNADPSACPMCSGRVYGGILQGRRHSGSANQVNTGLLFLSEPGGGAKRRGLLSRLVRGKSWFLSGGSIRARSCGGCRRLFIWGVHIDAAFAERGQPDNTLRPCPHCSGPLSAGQISLDPRVQGGARFECSDTPDFHRDWIRHNLLDRFVLNRWDTDQREIPALSCEVCLYTEIAGRPVYRFQ